DAAGLLPVHREAAEPAQQPAQRATEELGLGHETDVQAHGQLGRQAPDRIPARGMPGDDDDQALQVRKPAVHPPAAQAQQAAADPAAEGMAGAWGAGWQLRHPRHGVHSRSQAEALRWRLMPARWRLLPSRRSLDARVGLVATRALGALVATSSRAARRARASSRLRSWVRKRWALITSTPSAVSRRSRRASRRSRTAGGSEGEPATSKRSSTAVETLLTFCPPGPPARTKRSTSSCSGMARLGVTCSMGGF